MFLQIGDICTYTGTLISIPDIKPITTLEAKLGKENGHYASGENKVIYNWNFNKYLVTWCSFCFEF